MEQIVFIMMCDFTFLFLIKSYLFNSRSIYRQHENLLADCNHFLRIEIWNSRKASDFLHYIKFEFTNCQFHVAYIMVDLYTLYSLFYGIPFSDGHRKIEGIADTSLMTLYFACTMAYHILLYVVLFRFLNLKDDSPKSAYFILFVSIVISIVLYVVTIILYFNKFESWVIPN